MKGLIEIEGMEFYAYHGHYDIEKKVGNRFLVDIKIETNCEAAAQSDKLEDALDYQGVYSIIKEEMGTPSDLLEHVCGRILSRLQDSFTTIEHVTIKVSKMNPPMGGQIGKVSLSLSI